MIIEENYLIYPDGERQEIESVLHMNQVVDMNGRPLQIDFPPPRIIAYRIRKVTECENRGIRERLHFTELLNMEELRSYARNGI